MNDAQKKRAQTLLKKLEARSREIMLEEDPNAGVSVYQDMCQSMFQALVEYLTEQ